MAIITTGFLGIRGSSTLPHSREAHDVKVLLVALNGRVFGYSDTPVFLGQRVQIVRRK